jgi:hypothetical protein
MYFEAAHYRQPDKFATFPDDYAYSSAQYMNFESGFEGKSYKYLMRLFL